MTCPPYDTTINTAFIEKTKVMQPQALRLRGRSRLRTTSTFAMSHLYTQKSLRRVASATPSLSSSHCSISTLQYGVSFEFRVDQVGLANFDLSARYGNCISLWSCSHFLISALVYGVRLKIGFDQVAFVHPDVSAPCRICHSVTVKFAVLNFDSSVWCQFRIWRCKGRICQF